MQNDEREEFGRRVRELRQLAGWSQDVLAAKMSALGHPMHQTTVAKLESGARATPVEEVQALAVVFDMSPGELLDDAEMRGNRDLNGMLLRGRLATTEAALSAALDAVQDLRVGFDPTYWAAMPEHARRAWERRNPPTPDDGTLED